MEIPLEIPLMSVPRGQYDARPTVTFPVYAGTKFYCLVTDAQCVSDLLLPEGAAESNLRPVDGRSL